MFGGRLPSRMARMLSTTALAIASRTSATALPRCGVMVTLASRGSAGATSGSFSHMLRPGAGVALFRECRRKRGFVHHRPARRVDEEGGRFHQRNLPGADQVMG